MLCFYVHQPRLDIKPGYQWEAAGTHFDRNVTWWPQIHAWLDYLTRCQFLLQQGLFVADVLYFGGEDIPNFVPAKWMMEPALPPGYDCDTANAEVLLERTSVENGRIVLPDGMSYRLLVLPERETMSPHVLRKITELLPWNEHPQEGIRYFSGTATYRNVFDLRPDLNGKVLMLDLGKLKNVAEVRLNGHDLGVLWKPPFQVEITDTARPGRNELEIRITNLWPNRLIGDGKLPEANRFTKTNVQKFYQPPPTGEHQLLESGLMGPVRILATEELNVSL